MNSEHADASGYRSSHQGKGHDYDEFIAATPLDRYMAEWERSILLRIVPAIAAGGNGRYLDFACGTGRITSIVAPMSRYAVGVDVSSTMLDIAKAKCPSANFLAVDLTRESIDESQKFDFVTAFRFFGNAEQELRRAVLLSLNKHLRSGGYLILNSHRNPYALKNILFRATGGKDKLDLSFSKLRQLLIDSGFTVVNSYPVGFWLYRDSLAGRKTLIPEHGDRFERMFSWRMLANISPDSVIVVRKDRDI